MTIFENLTAIIAEQQKGHETKPRFMIGEQLKAIAEKEPLSAELLERDLAIKEMSLKAAERHFQQYADKNHGSAKNFCITPAVAEKLLREFYGLPKPDEAVTAKPEPEAPAGYIDLSAFL